MERRIVLTVEEAADLLGLTKSRVYDLCRQNILPVVRLGRQVRIHSGKLMEFIDSGGKDLPGGWKLEAE